MVELSSPPLPAATIATIWYEVDCWEHTASTGKRKVARARNAAVLLAVFGALFASLAASRPFLDAEAWTTAFALLSAASLASSGFLGRELLAPEQELGWVRARMLAEGLKREVWLCLARVYPYSDGQAGRVLQERASEMVAAQAVEKVAPPAAQHTSPPVLPSFDEYLALRVQPQVDWYRRRATELQQGHRKMRIVGLVIGLAAVIGGVLGVLPALGTSAWVPVLTTAAAALAAHVQANRYAAIVPVYQRTASRLDFLAAEWRDGWRLRCQDSRLGIAERARMAEIEFIDACESVMAQENESWQQEWLDGTAQRRTEEARKELLELATGNSQSHSPPHEPVDAPARGGRRGRGHEGRGGGHGGGFEPGEDPGGAPGGEDEPADEGSDEPAEETGDEEDTDIVDDGGAVG